MKLFLAATVLGLISFVIAYADDLPKNLEELARYGRPNHVSKSIGQFAQSLIDQGYKESFAVKAVEPSGGHTQGFDSTSTFTSPDGTSKVIVYAKGRVNTPGDSSSSKDEYVESYMIKNFAAPKKSVSIAPETTEILTNRAD